MSLPPRFFCGYLLTPGANLRWPKASESLAATATFPSFQTLFQDPQLEGQVSYHRLLDWLSRFKERHTMSLAMTRTSWICKNAALQFRGEENAAALR